MKDAASNTPYSDINTPPSWQRLLHLSREPGAGSREPGAGSREPGAGSGVRRGESMSSAD